ncbi:TetR/AcrR family transcriptional regulator C-terminal domain-containing protein [Amycolatopsis ultiminotia]|uniref:TetR/AcrR family transcriptional regulator C-terminal domain-containing protein n=1 Tax=Amycolatopsis ultiminotia TaxID=543629 RepID=A0ABP6WT87_9PSEU
MARETLSREKVLDAALGFVDTHGVSALSMRKLAAELGVEAMSLYNHVKNKGDLLDGLAARVFESVPLPDPAQPWETRVRRFAEACHLAFTGHPAVLRTLVAAEANPRSPGALRVIDGLLGALLEAGLDEPATVRVYRSLMGLIFGAALAETIGVTGVPADRAEHVDDWFRRMTIPAELPHLSRVLPALVQADCRHDLETQLDLLLTGLRAELAR